MCNHRVTRVCPALRQQRIGNTVGEIAIRRVVNFDELDRHAQRLKTGFNGIHHRACRAVTGIEHQLHRFQVAGIDVTQQVVDVGIARIDPLVAATFALIHRREVIRFRQTLHVAQTGITADGPCPFPHQLHAVVIQRIMAGGHFNAAINAKMESGEINLFGARHANIQHIHPCILQTFRQRQLQRLAGQADIAAEDDGFRLQKLAVSAANTPRNLFI
ncbi:Uncharacterised protein [Citrobacter werkmanii]|nr:Uncharacterised protein [Citrobacter werkmanii]